MREILFRAKRVDNGEWIYGAYVLCRRHHYILPYDYDSKFGYDERYTDFVEVDLETVGQYTGCKAKTGTRIFEGDIIAGEKYPYKADCLYNYYAEVCWWDNSPSFGIYCFKNPKSTVRGISEGNTEDMEDWNSDDWTVIGNIHDNPELLKDGGNK